MNSAIETVTHDRRHLARSGGNHRDSILQILRTMAGLYQLLPDQPITAAQRRAAAPHMIDNAPRLVGSMIRLLESSGADLPEAQQDPAELRELQSDADLYRLVRAQAFSIFLLANDAFQAHQSEAVARTRAALRRLRLSSRLLYRPGDPRRLLRQALTARVEAFDPRTPKASRDARESG